MLDLYDVGGDRWTELIALTRAAKQRGWWREVEYLQRCGARGEGGGCHAG